MECPDFSIDPAELLCGGAASQCVEIAFHHERDASCSIEVLSETSLGDKRVHLLEEVACVPAESGRKTPFDRRGVGEDHRISIAQLGKPQRGGSEHILGFIGTYSVGFQDELQRLLSSFHEIHEPFHL